jgi:hypothetical protein
MIIVPFPLGTVNELEIAERRDFETAVCNWIAANRDIADLSEIGDAVEIKDEVAAIYFRLRFGL